MISVGHDATDGSSHSIKSVQIVTHIYIHQLHNVLMYKCIRRIKNRLILLKTEYKENWNGKQRENASRSDTTLHFLPNQ